MFTIGLVSQGELIGSWGPELKPSEAIERWHWFTGRVSVGVLELKPLSTNLGDVHIEFTNESLYIANKFTSFSRLLSKLA